MNEPRTIACVGAGNVGRSWAILFASAGFHVRLWDSNPASLDAAGAAIGVSLSDMNAAGLVGAVDDIRARISVAASLEAALAGVEHVQESAFETLEIKRALFAALDGMAPAHVTLGSSTSAIPGSAFMEPLAGRARCVVVHPVNPPHLIRLVEICPTPWTAPETTARAKALMEAIGQAPVVLRKEAPGFLLNRLQWALMGEALHLVGEGYCDAADIDRVMTEGLAPRWSFLGPFEVGHLNATAGLAGYFSGLKEAMERVQDSVRADYRADAPLIERLHGEMAKVTPVEDIPRRQAWRDRRLMLAKAARNLGSGH